MSHEADWQRWELWRKQIERRLFEVASLAKGNLPTQAERIADVVEQIDDLRKQIGQIAERQEKMAVWLKKHMVHNGDSK